MFATKMQNWPVLAVPYRRDLAQGEPGSQHGGDALAHWPTGEAGGAASWVAGRCCQALAAPQLWAPWDAPPLWEQAGQFLSPPLA